MTRPSKPDAASEWYPDPEPAASVVDRIKDIDRALLRLLMREVAKQLLENVGDVK